MIRNFYLPLLLTAALLTAQPAQAAGAKKTAAVPAAITVEAQVDRSTITLGDPIVYTLTVRRDPQVQLLSPLTFPNNRDFEIAKTEDFLRKEDRKIVEGKKVTLTAFRLGEFVIDTVPVSAKKPDGTLQNLGSPRIYISVVSIQKGAPAADIRGIKSVIEIPLRFLRKYGVILAILGLIGTAALLIWRRFKKGGPAEISLREVLSPEDQALRDLHALFDSTLLRQGRFKEYFFSLSEIMRVYFEKHYLIFAVEATTSEILRLLKQKEIGSGLLADIQDLLEMADLAKFAKWKPDAPEVTRLNQKAEAIIKKAAAAAVTSHGI